MAKAKRKPIRTIGDLQRAINRAGPKRLRDCLFYIAREAFLEGCELDRDKSLGADFIGEVCNHLEAHGFAPEA